MEFVTEDGVVHAVDGITYQVHKGRTLGIVGESGSGKTVAAMTVLGLTRAQGARISGRILFEGRDLLSLPERRAALDQGQRDRDDLPGPALLAAPVLPRRRPAGRGDPRALGHLARAGASARDRAARPGRASPIRSGA